MRNKLGLELCQAPVWLGWNWNCGCIGKKLLLEVHRNKIQIWNLQSGSLQFRTTHSGAENTFSWKSICWRFPIWESVTPNNSVTVDVNIQISEDNDPNALGKVREYARELKSNLETELQEIESARVYLDLNTNDGDDDEIPSSQSAANMTAVQSSLTPWTRRKEKPNCRTSSENVFRVKTFFLLLEEIRNYMILRNVVQVTVITYLRARYLPYF